MVHFDFIFDVFSLLYNQSVVIRFASCQTSPGTSLECPQPIFLRGNNRNHLRIFENWGFRVSLGDCGCIQFLRNLKIYAGHI